MLLQLPSPRVEPSSWPTTAQMACRACRRWPWPTLLQPSLVQLSCSTLRPVTGNRFSFPATRWWYKVGSNSSCSASSSLLSYIILFVFFEITELYKLQPGLWCVWFYARLSSPAASGDVQAYQIRTAATGAITPGVVMATSPALGAGGVTEEVTRKREVRLMKNRYVWDKVDWLFAFVVEGK